MSNSALVIKEGYFIPSVPRPSKGRAAGPISFLAQLQLMRQVMKNPIETFADFQFEQPVSQFKMFGIPNFLINDPEMIRHCFVDNAANYKHSHIRQSILKPALGEGLVTAEGEQWRKSRKLLAPIFKPSQVTLFAERMKTRTENFLNELRGGSGQPVSVAEIMSKLTYLILSDTLFSGEISDDTEDLTQSIAQFLLKLGRPDPLDIIRAPAWLPRLTKLGGQRFVRQFRATVAKAIVTRQKTIDAGEEPPQDFMTLLLTARDEGAKLTQQEVEDNIITFIAAGHETTARGLAWMLYLLSQAPGYLQKVEAEVDVLDINAIAPEQWGDHLPWTMACFEEAMRLFPPAVMISRNAIEDDKCKNFHIPAGSLVLVSNWVLHRHQTLWDYPERFEPERFMGERRKKIDRFAYLPFGLGPRVCIGAKFALQEAIIILALLLRRFRFDYASDTPPWPVLKVTLQPDNGMPMWMHERV